MEQLADQEKLTIIYVTHYLEEIKPIFEKSLLLKNGRIFASGSTAELFTDERISAFLDRPVMIKKDEQAMMTIHIPNVEPKMTELLYED